MGFKVMVLFIGEYLNLVYLLNLQYNVPRTRCSLATAESLVILNWTQQNHAKECSSFRDVM